MEDIDEWMDGWVKWSVETGVDPLASSLQFIHRKKRNDDEVRSLFHSSQEHGSMRRRMTDAGV